MAAYSARFDHAFAALASQPAAFGGDDRRAPW
jgi:hypothetical protein